MGNVISTVANGAATVVKNVGDFVTKAAEVIVEGFLTVGQMLFNGKRTVLSAEDEANPPISHVLLVRKRGDLIPCFRNVLKSKNENAIENIRQELTELGLNHISDAFEKGVDMNMMCSKCDSRLDHLDELCYCVDAAQRCHHRKCCSFRNNRALTFN